MAGFKAHITGSTMVGVAYGYWGVFFQGMSIESGVLAAGLCAVSGMLPDLDSDTGVPLRETTNFGSAVVPMLMIDRFRALDMTPEEMAFSAMLIYLFMRFVLVKFFKRYTVHRGMWHSIPAMFSAGLLTYLLVPSPSEAIRVYKAAAVTLGFGTHLTMDEIWSVSMGGGRTRLKKSFGTAMKFAGNSTWANVSTYAKFFLLAYLAWCDHGFLHRHQLHENQMAIPELSEPAESWLQTMRHPFKKR
ncbi:metal-dependent hydrolase [Roseimaritima multifibrata]|uniref:metal-dependent hydrolase n=1 Tax=Roseimaritima multifibrata TaxID=1930274 RepID=UPI0011A0F2BC|nr:metal-dependent hydrolase [Roseimaritima multifibrata]